MGKKALLISALIFCTYACNAQSVFGKWKTVDDETGETKAIVELYEKSGKLYGKVVDILNEKRKKAVCSKCEGKLKDKPVLGMDIIDGFSEDDDGYYKGKRLTDPSKGLTVSGKVWLNPEDPSKLMVRGYLAFFYRTQTWLRITD